MRHPSTNVPSFSPEGWSAITKVDEILVPDEVSLFELVELHNGIQSVVGYDEEDACFSNLPSFIEFWREGGSYVPNMRTYDGWEGQREPSHIIDIIPCQSVANVEDSKGELHSLDLIAKAKVHIGNGKVLLDGVGTDAKLISHKVGGYIGSDKFRGIVQRYKAIRR